MTATHFDSYIAALSLLLSVNPAQEHRCLAVGNMSMSTPISEITAISEKIFLKDGTIALERSAIHLASV